MAHNCVQMTADADVKAINQAAVEAKGNAYIHSGKSEQIVAHTALVAGGESDSITFAAPEKTGDYPYICSFSGHYAASMKGMLKVSKQ